MCPQSCKQCDSGNSIQCGNFKNNEDFDCYGKAMQGHCEIDHYDTRWEMKNNCAKTCCEEDHIYS